MFLREQPHALDAVPDPTCADDSSIVIELVVQQRAPELLVALLATPAPDPTVGGFVFQRVPAVAPGADKGQQPITQFGRQAYAGQAKQRYGVAPGCSLPPKYNPMEVGDPAENVAPSQVVQQLKRGVVGAAREVVKALNG